MSSFFPVLCWKAALGTSLGRFGSDSGSPWGVKNHQIHWRVVQKSTFRPCRSDPVRGAMSEAFWLHFGSQNTSQIHPEGDLRSFGRLLRTSGGHLGASLGRLRASRGRPRPPRRAKTTPGGPKNVRRTAQDGPRRPGDGPRAVPGPGGYPKSVCKTILTWGPAQPFIYIYI